MVKAAPSGPTQPSAPSSKVSSAGQACSRPALSSSRLRGGEREDGGFERYGQNVQKRGCLRETRLTRLRWPSGPRRPPGLPH